MNFIKEIFKLLLFKKILIRHLRILNKNNVGIILIYLNIITLPIITISKVQGEEIVRRRTSNVCRNHSDCPRNAFCEKISDQYSGQCVCPLGYLIIANESDRECYKAASGEGDSCMFDEQCMITLSTESECKYNRCRCQQKTHFVPRANKCYKSVLIGDHCSFTNNCVGDGVVCRSGFCECPFGMHPNPERTKCIKDTKLGEICYNDQECLAPNSLCREICKCRHDFVMSKNNDTCLKVSNHVYDVCIEDSQCLEIVPNSKCDVKNRICVCSFGYHEIKYRCWVSVPLGGICEADENCAIVENSICENNHCICEENYVRKNGICSSSPKFQFNQRLQLLLLLFFFLTINL